MKVGKVGVYVGAYTFNDHQFQPFGVYVASSLNRNEIKVRRIPLPENSLPWDVITADGYLYILLEGKTGEACRLVQVFRAALADMTRPEELFRFNYEAFARSFEIADGDFYFGMGCEVNNPDAFSESELSPSTGRILRIRKGLLQ